MLHVLHRRRNSSPTGPLRARCNNPFVAYNRRQQRRQGIRYGPPRERERYTENGVLIGRFLGLGILLLASGVLAAGALAFVGDLPSATPSPFRTPFEFAPASGLVATQEATLPPPSESPTTLPLDTPAASSASPAFTVPPVTFPAATLLPTPGGTSAPPLVEIGEGFVTFGTRSDRGLHILDPRSTFAINERIVWSAFLTSAADSIQLHFQDLNLDPATPARRAGYFLDEPVTPLVQERPNSPEAHPARV